MAPTASSLEPLENRIAPASMVELTFESGVLSLTGDNSKHDFAITQTDSHSLLLKAATGTLFHLADDSVADTVSLHENVSSLQLTLGGNADSIAIADLSVPGDVSLSLGGGANVLKLQHLSIKGSLQVNGESGADTVTLLNMPMTIGKDANFALGEGNNKLTISSSTLLVSGRLSYTGGSGKETVTLNGSTLHLHGGASFVFGSGALQADIVPSLLTAESDLVFDSSLSAGIDTGSLNFKPTDLNLTGNLIFMTGSGRMPVTAQVSGDVNIHGGIQVISGPGGGAVTLDFHALRAYRLLVDASQATDDVTLQLGLHQARLPDGLKIFGGSDVDAVTVLADGALIGPVNIALGEGNNALQLSSTGGHFRGAVIYSGGAGNDTVQLALAGVSIGSDVSIDTGDGNASTTLNLIGGTRVGGQVNVSSSAHTGALVELHLAGAQAQIGSLTFTTGESADSLLELHTLQTPQTTGLLVRTTLRVTGGAGDDTIDLSANDLHVTKGIFLDLSDGENSVSANGTGYASPSLAISGGVGTDTVGLQTSGRWGNVVLALGSGANSSRLQSLVQPLLLGSLTVDSPAAADEPDDLVLSRLRVLGAVAALLGEGDSSVLLDDLTVGGRFDLITGGGADIVGFDTRALFTGSVLLSQPAMIDLGEGDDELLLGGVGPGQLVVAQHGFRVNAGGGVNHLANTASLLGKTPALLGF